MDPVPFAHDPWLVALSVLVAGQGAYVGLTLAGRVGAAQGARRRALLVGAAGALSVGIWSMHFIGLLAARIAAPVSYLVVPTVFSLLVCVIVVGAAVLLAATDLPRIWRIGAGGLGMGIGIVSMHHLGMGALSGALAMHHSPLALAGSLAVAVAASAAALWLCFELPGRRLPASAAAMGLAVSGMHYAAMAGLTLHLGPHPQGQFAVAVSPDGLALIVAGVAFAVSAAFLGLLAPERRTQAPATAREPAAAPSADVAPDPVETPPPAPILPATLPVERQGVEIPLPVAAIRAVRANAHYTYVSDGAGDYFCSLSIGEVEAALDPTRFLRVHRSHIVALDHVVAVRKAGDNGAVELAGGAVLPVARGRLPTLKRRFATGYAPSGGRGGPAMGQHA